MRYKQRQVCVLQTHSRKAAALVLNQENLYLQKIGILTNMTNADHD